MKDVEEKEKIEIYMKQLENPFGFLDTMKEIDDDDEEDDEDEVGEDGEKV